MATKKTRTNSDNDNRLDRIEHKLDTLNDAMVNIARAEEKISGLTSFSKQQHQNIKDLITRIDVLESDMSSNRMIINIINKVFWILIAAVVSSVTGILLLN